MLSSRLAQPVGRWARDFLCQIRTALDRSGFLLVDESNRGEDERKQGRTHPLVRRGEDMTQLKWYTPQGLLLGIRNLPDGWSCNTILKTAQRKSRFGFASVQEPGYYFSWFKNGVKLQLTPAVGWRKRL